MDEEYYELFKKMNNDAIKEEIERQKSTPEYQKTEALKAIAVHTQALESIEKRLEALEAFREQLSKQQEAEREKAEKQYKQTQRLSVALAILALLGSWFAVLLPYLIA